MKIEKMSVVDLVGSAFVVAHAGLIFSALILSGAVYLTVAVTAHMARCVLDDARDFINGTERETDTRFGPWR